MTYKSSEAQQQSFTDMPLTKLKDDKLGRAKLAKQLAEFIFEHSKGSHNSSYTVAVLGKWGEGKTSYINFVKEQLQQLQQKEDQKLEIIEFTPWYFSEGTNLYQQFFALITDKLEASPIIKRLKSSPRLVVAAIIFIIIGLYNFFPDLADALVSRFLGFYKFVGIAILIVFIFLYFLGVDINLCLKAIKNYSLRSMNDILKKLLAEDQLFDVHAEKEKIKEYIKKSNRKLIIIIDDIDRLKVAQLNQVFDLVKGLGDFPNTIYMLAFDKEVVAEALNKDHVEKGSAYLEKFIQHEIRLPPITGVDMESFLDGKLEHNAPKDESENYKVHLLALYLTNLREAKRFCNLLEYKYTLLKGNVEYWDLVFLTAIEVNDSPIYHLLWRHKKLLCGCEDAQKDLSNFKQELKQELEKKNIKMPEGQSSCENLINGMFFSDAVSMRSGSATAPEELVMSIRNPGYFNVYFQFMTMTETFRELEKLEPDQNKLNSAVFDLINSDSEEFKISDPDDYWTRLLDQVVFSSKKPVEWFLALAWGSEKLAEQEQNTDSSLAHGFIECVGKLLLKEFHSILAVCTKENYLLLRMYCYNFNTIVLSAAQRDKLKERIAENLQAYSNENKLYKLPYFCRIIAFSIKGCTEDAEQVTNPKVIDIIKQEITAEDEALLALLNVYKEYEGVQRASCSTIEKFISFSEIQVRLRKMEKDIPFFEKRVDEINSYLQLIEKQLQDCNN